MRRPEKYVHDPGSNFYYVSVKIYRDTGNRNRIEK